VMASGMRRFLPLVLTGVTVWSLFEETLVGIKLDCCRGFASLSTSGRCILTPEWVARESGGGRKEAGAV